MRKSITIALVVTLAVALLVSGVVYGSGMRASKATAVVGNLTWLAPNTQSWETVLDQSIKMAQQKDLFVDVSMLCGLFTQTEVTATSQDPEWAEGTAVAKIMVRVYAEDEDEVKHWASPTAGFGNASAGIIFAMRQQDLWAKLNTCNVTDNMTIGLALDTMDAHAFNFIIPNLDSGEYDVVVQAMTCTDPPVAVKGKNKGAGNAAWAGIGFGSVTIEQVRMAKGTVWIEPEP